MTSSLSVATSGLSPAVVMSAIPPACRGAVGPAPRAPSPSGPDEAVVETAAWAAGGAVHLVPSFSALTEVAYSVRLELSVRLGGAWSPWVAGIALGPAAFEPLTASDALEVDVDVFRARAPVEAVRARARVRGPASVLGGSWMLALSAAGSASPVEGRAPVTRPMRLPVPALSQMEADALIASRICSPTCVAMVLGYWNRRAPLSRLAAEIFHPGLDLYGVWPAAIRVAGRHRLAGYLLRFPDWPAVVWCLEQRLPVIASIRYKRGELTGAAIEETSGHLIVVTGCEDRDALVNDPAASETNGVARRYSIEELARVWLERAGVGYVLFPPDARSGRSPG